MDSHRSRAAVTAAWFNTNAFGVPTTDMDANNPTESSDQNVDRAISRGFKIHERV